MQHRQFTLEEANQLVPWLERTFQRLNSSMERLETLKGRLSELQRVQLRLNGTFGRHNEINSMQSELDEMSKELQGMVDDIVAEGIIIRDISRGLVDFPHLREGQEVYLCWVSGEQSIDFWHETNRGFDHRQPL